MLTKINRVWAIVVLIAATMGMTSCLKNNVDMTPSRPVATVMVANLSKYDGKLDLYANGEKMNKSPLTGFFFSGVTLYGGNYEFKATVGDKDSVLTTTSRQLDSLGYYSYYIFGKNPVRSAIVETDLTKYSQTAINLRFYHLSPNAGPVDVYFGTTKILENQTYIDGYFNPTFTLYTNITEGNVITIKKAGTAEVLATNNNLSVTNLQTGNIYTAYFIGDATVANDFTANVIYGAR